MHLWKSNSEGVTVAAAPAPVSTSATTQSGKSSTSAGTIAGAVVGGVVGLGLLAAALAFFVIRRRRRRNDQALDAPNPKEEGESRKGLVEAGRKSNAFCAFVHRCCL